MNFIAKNDRVPASYGDEFIRIHTNMFGFTIISYIQILFVCVHHLNPQNVLSEYKLYHFSLEIKHAWGAYSFYFISHNIEANIHTCIRYRLDKDMQI